MVWETTQAHEEARAKAAAIAANQASVRLADTGAGNSTLKLYTVAAGTLLTTIVLAKPCATVDANTGAISFVQLSETGDLVMVTGAPTFAQWCDGSGVVTTTCSVSPPAGDGDIKVSTREDGLIFAGGFVSLTGGQVA